MALPTSVCIQLVASKKFLRYRYEDGESHGLLQFAADTVMDPYAHFEVEKSKTYDDLVHLKCRYTNKYLVRWSPNHDWISPSAYDPIEDQSSWTCTLFKPIFVVDPEGTGYSPFKTIRLQHVQLGNYLLSQANLPAPFDSCLYAGSKDIDNNSLDVFSILDREAIFKLPKYVAFKGDNGKYLGANPIKGQPGLQFAYSDPEDTKVQHETLLSPDGIVYIKSVHYGKFWRVTDEDWVVADANDPRQGSSQDNYTSMFRVSALDRNVVALLSMENTQFCKRYTDPTRESYLSADTKTITAWARLEVVDLSDPFIN